MKYHLVCGMEIHAELKTASKMFCSCQNDPFHAPKPNMYTCPVCLGMPGGLPVPNKRAIEWTIKLGLALHAEIHLISKFDRKHYFYPDLPKGYQISQYDIPFCTGGYVETTLGRVNLTRIHLEEDTGKLQHITLKGKKVSLVDFNRSGVPLIEIVSEPDIHSPEQAVEYAKNVRQLIRYLEIGDCDMEQGGMRLEANTSLQTEAQLKTQQLPEYKVEVKNINSFRFLKAAMEYEVARQNKELSSGSLPAQETRGWNATKQVTQVQRTKESAEDYRYFPDPDIPPIELSQKQVADIQRTLPKLPETYVTEWETQFGVEPRFGESFVNTSSQAEWASSLFTAAKSADCKPNDLAKALVNKRITVAENEKPVTVITQFQAASKTSQVDQADLSAAIAEILSEHPTELHRYQSGEKQLLGFFIGQVKQKLDPSIDVQAVIAALEKQT